MFLTYLISYPVFRFFMEFLRLDNSLVGGINANQTLMLVIAVASAGFLVWRHKKDKQETTEDDPSDDANNDE